MTWSRWPTGRTPTDTGCGPRACPTTGRRSCCHRAAPGPAYVLRGHHPGPDLGDDQRGLAGHGHGGHRRHDGHADQRDSGGRLRVLRDPGARRHHGRRRAGHQRARQRDPGDRRDHAVRPDLRLALEPDPVPHRGRLELLVRAVRADDVPALEPGHPRVPGAPGPRVHHLGHAAARRAPEPAVPELGGHLGRGPVRPASQRGVQFARQLRWTSRPRRGDLVPVHRHAVAEGVVDQVKPAAALGEGRPARTTTRSRTA